MLADAETVFPIFGGSAASPAKTLLVSASKVMFLEIFFIDMTLSFAIPDFVLVIGSSNFIS